MVECVHVFYPSVALSAAEPKRSQPLNKKWSSLRRQFGRWSAWDRNIGRSDSKVWTKAEMESSVTRSHRPTPVRIAPHFHHKDSITTFAECPWCSALLVLLNGPHRMQRQAPAMRAHSQRASHRRNECDSTPRLSINWRQNHQLG